MSRKDMFIKELDWKEKVLSALLSVLTLFALLGKVAPIGYAQMPKYTEWVCGLTTWSAYNKQMDLWIVQAVLFGLPLMYLLFGWGCAYWKRLQKNADNGAGIYFCIAYIMVLFMSLSEQSGAIYFLGWFFLSVIGYICLRRIGQEALFSKLVFASLITMMVLVALMMAGSSKFPRIGSLWQEYAWFLHVIGAIIFLLLVMVTKLRQKCEWLFQLQIALPLAWLGMIHFRYRFQSEEALMELFYSGRWKWFCIGMCILLFFMCGIEMKKDRKNIYLSTFIMAAVIRVFSQPDGLLNVDFFHNGEISMPMQQLVSFGKLPYSDMIPIHGLCDYFYGAINYLFFDGTYISLNAAKIVGDLAMAVLIAIIIYVYVRHRWQGFALVYLLIPYMVQMAGMRYFFLFLMFFVLFSEKMKKGLNSLYAWTLLSIMAIAWNASIGGAVALAFLPVILYRCRRIIWEVREIWFERNKKKRNLIFAAWGLLFVLGIAFIPVFLQIVIYLKENTKTTLYVNGMEMVEDVSMVSSYLVPSMITGQNGVFLSAFVFIFPILISFGYALHKKKSGAGELFVTYLLGFLVLANYAFVRFDEGLRSTVLGIALLMFTTITLLFGQTVESYKEGKTEAHSGDLSRMLYAAFWGLAIYLAGVNPLMNAESLVMEKEIPSYLDTTIMGEEIEDPVVYVSGESVGIQNLGTGFIQGNTLESLQNVRELIEVAKQQGKTVFDITNAVANAVIFDTPVFLPYSSAYNISNDVMQRNAIAKMEEQLPDIILAAPEIRFDDAPFSFRSRKLYRFIMQQDYVPYKFENVIYLARGENPLPNAERNEEAYAQLMHKKDLSYLPAVWGSNASQGMKTEDMVMIDTEVSIEETEQGVRVVFDEPLNGKEVSMLEITSFWGIGVEEDPVVTMTVESSDASLAGAEYRFALKGDRYMIPVGCSPYWLSEPEMKALEFVFENGTYDRERLQEMSIRCYGDAQ